MIKQINFSFKFVLNYLRTGEQVKTNEIPKHLASSLRAEAIYFNLPDLLMENGSRDDDVLRLLDNSTKRINSTLNNIQYEILHELRQIKRSNNEFYEDSLDERRTRVHTDILSDILSETKALNYKV